MHFLLIAVAATVNNTDSTDIAHRILTDTLVLASASFKRGWKGICHVRRRLVRRATYLF